MKKENLNKLLMACACVGAGYLLGHLGNITKTGEEPQAKEIVEDAKSVYNQKCDSLDRHYHMEKVGLYNKFRSAVEDINDSRAGKATKNAAIAKEATQYIADHDSVHTVWFSKFLELNENYR